MKTRLSIAATVLIATVSSGPVGAEDDGPRRMETAQTVSLLALRTSVIRYNFVEADGTTLTELLADLDVRYPGIRFRMINEQDRLRPHMRVFINRESVDLLETTLDPNDEVVILQSLSGG